jgi:tRNA(fMet)-specific endonuclease VapC
MYLLDTDNMTLLERAGPEGARLKARVATIPQDDLATTIVSYEEQTRGWLSVSARARTPEAQIAAYRRLKTHLQIYCKIVVIDYDEKAAAEFERLWQAKIRIGTMDLKIAAIALANDATLLTRNLSDFSKVPGLKAEDWSV